MDIEKRVNDLKNTLNSSGESTDKTFEVLDKYLIEAPNDERLWDARGDYIQKYNGENEALSFEEAKRSYLKAIECNEKYARAYESLGYFHDVIEDDYILAEKYFRKAISINATVDSYKGLARVLAQQNRAQEAIQVLSNGECQFSDEIDFHILKDEIQSGYWESKI